MRHLLALLFGIALVPGSAPADTDKKDPKPNTLTAKEIADGWLLLFDGESTFGWDCQGDVKVKHGALFLLGDKRARALTTASFGPGELRFECRWIGKTKPKLYLRGRPVTQPELAFWKLSWFQNRWTPVALQPALAQNSQPLGILGFETTDGSALEVRSVKFRPLGLNSLFNGKDLTGWKKYTGNPKREKSKFTVTREGWLNVKDGPGDLQTEKLYDDFVLQLECISNGKHLNSGIFFRCLPGQYQQGYEAQIRNQFTEKPTQKYTIQDYDPKTNKLVGKRTILSPAVDYGTGAIYRRMPARSAVAKDREWFTMTVVARGRHFATWVNGVQQVDWTDNRPVKDNAREGYRAEKGAISIQGHDPTTDLSFRNIRIEPLARRK
jgi:hypothetical protein